MENGTNPDYGQAFAAALDWWREAGVDTAFVDEPRTWLAPPPSRPDTSSSSAPAARAPATAKPQQSKPESVPVARSPTLPDDLDTFRSWWMNAPELDHGRVAGRVAPRGSTSPRLMILAPAPESVDREHLFSGPEGKLLDSFLSAAGVPEQAVYRASVLPCHSPGADWSSATTSLLSEVLIRHVGLVQPQRILVFGLVILPLLGNDSPQGAAVSSSFNHDGATIPMLAVRRIPAAASQPRWKAALWQAWLDWSALGAKAEDRMGGSALGRPAPDQTGIGVIP